MPLIQPASNPPTHNAPPWLLLLGSIVYRRAGFGCRFQPQCKFPVENTGRSHFTTRASCVVPLDPRGGPYPSRLFHLLPPNLSLSLFQPYGVINASHINTCAQCEHHISNWVDTRPSITTHQRLWRSAQHTQYPPNLPPPLGHAHLLFYRTVCRPDDTHPELFTASWQATCGDGAGRRCGRLSPRFGTGRCN